MKFKNFIGPWINNQGVGIYIDAGESKWFRAETSRGESLSDYIPVTQEEIDRIVAAGHPYNDAQPTIEALRRCGINVNLRTSSYRPDSWIR